jgi:hypothetical protein
LDNEIAIFDKKKILTKFQAVIFQVFVIKTLDPKPDPRPDPDSLKCWIWIRIQKNNESGSTTLNVTYEEDPSPAYGTDVNDVVGGGL